MSDDPTTGLPEAPLLPPPERQFSTFLHANRFYLLGVLLLILAFCYLLITNGRSDVIVAINRYRRPWADTLFIYGTRLGEPEAYVVVALIASAIRYRTALFTIVTGLLALIVSAIAKFFFSEARPMRWIFDNAEEVWHSLSLFDENMRNWSEVSSFPSGHTTSAFALYGFVCFNIRRPKVLASIVCFLLAFEVGFSRMYLLYHFLRDVTAGAVLGTLLGAAAYLLQFYFFPHNKMLDTGWWPSRRRRPGAPALKDLPESASPTE